MTISDTATRVRLIKEEPINLIYEGPLPDSPVAHLFRHARDCVKGSHYVISPNTKGLDCSGLDRGSRFRAIVTHANYVAEILEVYPATPLPTPS